MPSSFVACGWKATRPRYRPGLLPEVVRHAESKVLPDGLAPLPVVLVLDEINRTDLSAMFGEAFSLLEAGQRGRAVTLPGINQQRHRSQRWVTGHAISVISGPGWSRTPAR
jgi:hypothetical protein